MTDHDEADERPRRPVRRPAPAAAGHGGGGGPRWDDPNAVAPPAAPPDPRAAPSGRGEAWTGTSAVDRRPVRRPRVTYTSATGAGPTAPGPASAAGSAPAPGGPFIDGNAWAAGLRNAEATAARPAPPRPQVPLGYEGLPGPRDEPGQGTPGRPAAATAAGPVVPAPVGVPGPLRHPVSPESTLPGVPRGALTPGVPSGPMAAGAAGAAALAGGPPTGAWSPEATMPPSAAGPTTAGWPSPETTQAHPATPAPGGPGATGVVGDPTVFTAGSPASPAAAAGAGATYDAGYGEVRDPYGPWSPPPTGADGLPLWEDEGDKPGAGRTKAAAAAAGAAPAGDEGSAGRRPGLGLLVGILGLAALVVGFVALPWATEGGREASFLDLRDAVTAAGPGTPDSGGLPSLGASGDGELAAAATGAGVAQAPGETVPPGGEVTTTVPAGAPPATAPTTLPGTPPSSAMGGAATSTVPGAAGTTSGGDPTTATTAPTARPAPASPLDPSAGGRRADFAQMFVEYLWVVVLAVAAMAVLFTTLWVPRSRGGRMATGLLVSGPVGFLANAVDKAGSVGPRVAGVAGTVAAAALYGAAVFAIFGREPAPEPALGVWVGEAGLAAVLMACLIGARRAQA